MTNFRPLVCVFSCLCLCLCLYGCQFSLLSCQHLGGVSSPLQQHCPGNKVGILAGTCRAPYSLVSPQGHFLNYHPGTVSLFLLLQTVTTFLAFVTLFF